LQAKKKEWLHLLQEKLAVNKILWGIVLCLPLYACGGDYSRRGDNGGAWGFDRDERPRATTLVYACEGYEFIARLGPGEMAVWLEDRYVVLSQVRSASGVLYEEGDVSVWSKGDEALLNIDQQRYQSCHLVPARIPWEDARRRGVDFRAQGNEPGWSLELKEGSQLLFVEDYGSLRVLIPAAGETRADGIRVYDGNADATALRVEIDDSSCVDTMSGDIFPASVVVTLNNRVYSGCGQTLDYPWLNLE
jgi:putative lipoprotein